LDFADIKSVIKNAGNAILGDGIASGESRAIKAAQNAINSPLIETSIEGANGILLNISGGPDLKLFEVNQAAEIIRNASSPNANVIFGAVIDESMSDKVKVTIIATGFEPKKAKVMKTVDGINKKKEVEKKLFEFEKDILAGKDKKEDFKKISEDDLRSLGEDDYLDIPTFLRKNKK